MKALLQKSISIIPPTFSPVNEKADGPRIAVSVSFLCHSRLLQNGVIVV